MESSFSPREIVSELDKFIIGQTNAKKAVAVALRNRWRRKQLPANLREEILPKNILMVGPTGCGKTEISRRLAKLANAPFIKVEATKFTEVGYVGRDVEQIIRDLVEISISQTKITMGAEVKAHAEKKAEERILDVLVSKTSSASTREGFRNKLRTGELKILCLLMDNPEILSASTGILKKVLNYIDVDGDGEISAAECKYFFCCGKLRGLPKPKKSKK